MKFLLKLSLFFYSLNICFGQEPELKSIEDVISGIDSLLQEIDRSSENDLKETEELNQALQSDNPGPSRSFRAENELIPEELRADINAVPVDQVGVQTAPPVPANPGILNHLLLSKQPYPGQLITLR